jgi:hypothetical protein
VFYAVDYGRLFVVGEPKIVTLVLKFLPTTEIVLINGSG